MTLVKYATLNEKWSFANFINVSSKFENIDENLILENQKAVKKCLDFFQRAISASNEHFDELLESNPKYLVNILNTLISLENSKSSAIQDLSESFKPEKEAFYDNFEQHIKKFTLTSNNLQAFTEKKRNISSRSREIVDTLTE